MINIKFKESDLYEHSNKLLAEKLEDDVSKLPTEYWAKLDKITAAKLRVILEVGDYDSYEQYLLRIVNKSFEQYVQEDFFLKRKEEMMDKIKKGESVEGMGQSILIEGLENAPPELQQFINFISKTMEQQKGKDEPNEQ
jgi:hypothetical protein